MKMSGMDWLIWVLLFVGGLNWGLVGFFDFDLVTTLFGTFDPDKWGLTRIVYSLVGLAAVWSLISMFMKGGSGEKM